MSNVSEIVAAVENFGLTAKHVELGQLKSSHLRTPTCIVACEPGRERVIDQIAQAVNRQLAKEMPHWQTALDWLDHPKNGFLAEIDPFSHLALSTQPWLIIDAPEGGLDCIRNAATRNGGRLVTCAAVNHHGVLRLKHRNSYTCVLATGRMPGGDWNPADDFGHEGAHAALGQVPLFSQALQGVAAFGFASVLSEGMTDEDTIGLWCYVASEVLVWFVRNEIEATETGIRSLRSQADLAAFIQVSIRLGTIQLGELSDFNGLFEQSQPRSRALARACLRGQRATRRMLDWHTPPTYAEWKALFSD